MKKLLLSVGLVLSSFAPGWTQDYELLVDGVMTPLALDQPVEVELEGGKKIQVVLRQKEQLTFSSQLFSFEHASRYKPTKSTLGPGLDQSLVVSPMGTGIIVQEYRSLNPSGLIDLMAREVTKDEVKAGYEYREEAVEHKIGEKTFVGKKLTTTQGDSQWEREVLTYAEGDQGLLVVTFIEKGQFETERPLLEQFWETLRPSF